MTLSAVASRYASALADVVTAEGSGLRPEDAVAQLRSFESTLRGSPELHNVLATPAIPGSRKKAVVGRIAEVLAISRLLRNFLFVLVDHRRIASLPQIIQSFEEIVDQRMGYARVAIATARELTQEQQSYLVQRLEGLVGSLIRLHYTVDESLIGGIVARIGSTVYDGSLRTQLATLQSRLGAES